MTTYVTKHVTVDAVQWTGGNLAEIRDFAGPDFIEAPEGRIWVRNAEGPFEVRDRWWISRRPGGPLIVHSQAAWTEIYAPAGGTA